MEKGQIISCYASAVIDAGGTADVHAGGIAGQLASTLSGQGVITACYAWVQIKADGTGTNSAGGIAGHTFNTGNICPGISGSYARGRVEAAPATTAYAGGITGRNQGEIKGCIALNDRIESSASSDVHGIAGSHLANMATYPSDNYAASGITFTRAGSSTNSDLIGNVTKAHADFTGQANISNYPGGFWNFATNGDWKWISGYGYPVLAWQTTAPRDPAAL
jgi:hypothetical protein